MTNSFAGKHDPIFHQDRLNIVLQHTDLPIQQSVLAEQLPELSSDGRGLVHRRNPELTGH